MLSTRTPRYAQIWWMAVPMYREYNRNAASRKDTAAASGVTFHRHGPGCSDDAGVSAMEAAAAVRRAVSTQGHDNGSLHMWAMMTLVANRAYIRPKVE